MNRREIICVRCNEPGMRQPNGKYCLACAFEVNKIQGKAYQWVKKAIKDGSIPPIETQYCVDCGAFAKHYDHRDYAAPLDVEPVCRSCNYRRGPIKWRAA